MRAVRRLEAERTAARAVVGELRAELDGIIADQEVNQPDDEHDVEGSSIGYERARVSALLAHAEAHLVELGLASARLARGGYGRCETCHGPVGEDRLAALPTARRCFGCSVDQVRRGLRS